MGMARGWCGPPVCATHDGLPTTPAEDAECEDGGDPCLHVIRPYHDAQERADIEAHHPPSLWRARPWQDDDDD